MVSDQITELFFFCFPKTPQVLAVKSSGWRAFWGVAEKEELINFYADNALVLNFVLTLAMLKCPWKKHKILGRYYCSKLL